MEELTTQQSAWLAEHPEWLEPQAAFSPEHWNTERVYVEPKAQATNKTISIA
jgi:hypothetical protein